MDRHELVQWWDEAYDEGVWWAAWRRAVDGLTAEQAAWKPAPDRHSIWQLVNHMIFWRDYFAERVRGGAAATEAELDRQSWHDPDDVSDAAWRATYYRFAESHARLRAVMADPETPAAPRPELDLRYLLFHDTYHIGQVMYVRALMGLEPLES